MSKLIDKLVNKAIGILSRYKDRQEVKEYISGIRSSQKKLKQSRSLTQAQEKEIQEFYAGLLGHPIPLEWHRFFYSRTGIYSKLYLPTSEYKTNIVGRLNVYPLKRAYTDKNLSDVFLPSAHQPRIYLKNMNGFYYYEGKAVSSQEALEKCRNLGDVIIKPSLSSRGMGVRVLHIREGRIDNGNQTLEEVFKEYGSDFQLDELVRQHKDMSALNPTSINTIRLLTYRTGMDVRMVYSVIRIGRKGKTIDNESAGGISTQILPDGTLGKYAYGAPGNDRIEYTDCGVRLDGYRIPSYQDAVEKVKEYHLQFPFFNLMAWDIAIEEDGTPTLIEFNVTPDLSQSANGPAFGEYTEEILKDAMSRRNTWSRIGASAMWRMNVGSIHFK